MSRIVCLHGVPKKIVSGRGSQFTSMFWENIHECIDTKLNFSLAYHLQTDGEMERTNQILEDMLRACALKYGKSWDKSLPYAEFSYNNSYQPSIEMAPFEALYGQQCRTPLFSIPAQLNKPSLQQLLYLILHLSDDLSVKVPCWLSVRPKPRLDRQSVLY
jgi:transposase InsO family protein